MTLIKRTLSSLPTYFILVFTIPISVAQRLEKLQRDFLWDGSGEEFKYQHLDWDVVCYLIQQGGLGVRRHAIFNHSLLANWLGIVACERDR